MQNKAPKNSKEKKGEYFESIAIGPRQLPWPGQHYLPSKQE
jgi:hypothetical protein